MDRRIKKRKTAMEKEKKMMAKKNGLCQTAYLAHVDLPSSASRCFPATPAREGFPFSARLSKKWRVSMCV